MKISEMTNDQAAEAMIRLGGPLGAICDDEEALKMIDEYKKTYLTTPLFYAVGRLIPRLATYFMQTHKNELYEIVAILSEKKVSEISKMSFKDTIKILRDSWDEVADVFFPSSVNVRTKGATK